MLERLCAKKTSRLVHFRTSFLSGMNIVTQMNSGTCKRTRVLCTWKARTQFKSTRELQKAYECDICQLVYFKRNQGKPGVSISWLPIRDLHLSIVDPNGLAIIWVTIYRKANGQFRFTTIYGTPVRDDLSASEVNEIWSYNAGRHWTRKRMCLSTNVT